jgi:AcrR family transcriptional regulator
MPPTRRGVERDEKVDAILDAAEQRLLAGGYAAMSIAAIARELGVAQNTLYWYFPSKDDLLVAVARRLMPRVAATKPPKDAGLAAHVLWYVDRMADLSVLRSAVLDRARSSPVAADFVGEFHAVVVGLLRSAVAGRLPPDDLDVAVEAFAAAVDGVLARGLPADERHRILRYAVDHLLTPGDGAGAAVTSG